MRSASAALVCIWVSLFFVYGGGSRARAAGVPVFEVPKLSGIVVDGILDDWGDGGLKVNLLAPSSGDMPLPEDVSAKVRIGWDDEGLLVCYLVRDDKIISAPDKAPYNCDSVELFLVGAWDAKSWVQAAICPAADFDPEGLRKEVYPFPRDSVDAAGREKIAADISAGIVKVEGGYTVEVRLPWSSVSVKPAVGTKVAFNPSMNDRDMLERNDRFTLAWQPNGWAGRGPQFMQRMVLAESAGPDVNAAATVGPAKSLRQALVTTYMVGSHAQVTLAGLAEEPQTTITQLPGNISKVEQLVNLTTDNRRKQVTVTVGEQAIQSIILPDRSGDIRRKARSIELSYRPIFTGTELPPVKVANPEWALTLLGPYELKVSYLDAAYKPVTQADSNGRYGAVIELVTESLGKVTYHVTLCRVASELRFAPATPDTVTTTLSAYGVSPQIVARQRPMIDTYLRNVLAGQTPTNMLGAFVAALLECKPGDAPMAVDEWIDRDSDYWDKLPGREPRVSYPYVIDLPTGYEKDETKTWPLIVILHGGGQQDRSIKAAETPGDPSMIRKSSRPFVIIRPQCVLSRAGAHGWDPGSLSELIDETVARYRVDLDRVYMFGASMGGMGTWSTVLDYPGRFAAVMVICGSVDVSKAWRAVNTPVWIFHGGDDTVVPYRYGVEANEALVQLGGLVKFTTYPGVGHNSWENAFREPKFYTWLLANERGKTPILPDEFDLPTSEQR